MKNLICLVISLFMVATVRAECVPVPMDQDDWNCWTLADGTTSPLRLGGGDDHGDVRVFCDAEAQASEYCDGLHPPRIGPVRLSKRVADGQGGGTGRHVTLL